MNQEELKFIVDAVKKAHKALDEHSFVTAERLDTPTAMGTARGYLSCIIPDLEKHLAEMTATDATPIDADTFDGDVFSDALNAWVIEQAHEMGFEFDYTEIANEMPDECFNFVHSGWQSGTHEFGSDGWNECVKDYWMHDMDAGDKAQYIIKKDSEDAKS